MYTYPDANCVSELTEIHEEYHR